MLAGWCIYDQECDDDQGFVIGAFVGSRVIQS